MRKIGYIYKFDNKQNLGILVYGHWIIRRVMSKDEINKPLLFSSKDCISEVKTGCLVYFSLSGNKASNIERASLANFDKELIDNIISWKTGDSLDFYYDEKTSISYENLNDIRLEEEKIELLEDDDFIDEIDSFVDDDDLLNIDEYESDEFCENKNDHNVTGLPENISELYQYFGKYPHKSSYLQYNNDSEEINILNLSLWLDSTISKEKCFGENFTEALYLYDVFVRKMRTNKQGEVEYAKLSNDNISPLWALLLAKLSEIDLREIFSRAKLLQPALPHDFCKKNLDMLTDDYGMPSIDICKSFCLYKINNTSTAHEYKKLKNDLYVYANCNAKHLKYEGTPMCKMGKDCINNFTNLLEKQFESVVKPNVIAQAAIQSENEINEQDLRELSHDVLLNIGEYLEEIECCKKTSLNIIKIHKCEKALEILNTIPQLFQDKLRAQIVACTNETIIIDAKDEETSPSSLSYHLSLLREFISDSTIQQIHRIANKRFSNLDNLEELNWAFYEEFITEKQYLYKYKEITKNYIEIQFIEELKSYKKCDFPITIQWHIVSRIIDLLDYKDLSSFNYVKIDYEVVCDIKSLIKWLNLQKDSDRINETVYLKAEKKICSVLSADDRWDLFKENIIQSPGIDNIRNYLDFAYKKFTNEEYLKRSCFQDAMLIDAESITDTDVLTFIADNLDKSHQHSMMQKSGGFLKFYLWQVNPTISFDWELVKANIHKANTEIQIRVLRYIFGLMASGNISLSFNELYSAFVESDMRACSAIRGVLYFIKEKMNDYNTSITPSMFESVTGERIKDRYDFAAGSKDLFYPCRGYLAITPNEYDTEYLSFNGILTKETKDDAIYYVITFYESPVNLYGDVIEWLDYSDIELAKKVLERNESVEFVNGRYYILESKSLFVKQYVMSYYIDDKCGLLSDIASMKEQGYMKCAKHFYTNYLRKYEDSGNYICRSGCVCDSDPKNKIPFYWCEKKICTRRAHFLLPSSKWDKYRFPDLLYIALGQKPEIRERVWRINGEISTFVNKYVCSIKAENRNFGSAPIDESDDIGIWTQVSSTYREIYDENQYDDEGNYYDCAADYEKQTYDRYNGSYAQDEMDYSDDDIDTIFDGNPDAYWNID